MLTGFIIAVIAVVAAVFAWSAFRPVPPIEADFGERKISFVTPVPPDEAFKIVASVGLEHSYKLGGKDETRGRVLLHDGPSMTSWGYYYPVDITKGSDGQTRVTIGIKAKYPLQFGPLVRAQHEKANRKISDHLKARIEAKAITA